VRICVTGGSGFIGEQLVKQLEARGDELVLLTRTAKANAPHRQYFVADLVDQALSLAGLLDGVSVIYHCAGEIKNPALMQGLHVDGTARLLAAVEQHIKATQQPIHWVQLSSVGAYGSSVGAAHDVRVVTEATLTAPQGEYEKTKTVSDELVMAFAANKPLFSYTILRPSNVIGSSMTNQSLRALVGMIKKGRFFYIGSRLAVATYIHVEDVVAALLLCGEDDRAKREIFNLSNDCPLSDMVDAVAQASGIASPKLCVPEQPLRILVKLITKMGRSPLTQARIDALVRRTYYPATKIKEVLGFVPQQAIPRVVAAMFEGKTND